MNCSFIETLPNGLASVIEEFCPFFLEISLHLLSQSLLRHGLFFRPKLAHFGAADKQFVAVAFIGDLALFEDDDPIRTAEGGAAMGSPSRILYRSDSLNRRRATRLMRTKVARIGPTAAKGKK